MKLSTLIEETVAPHRDFGVAIKVRIAVAGSQEPVGSRNPAILYGVGNILENAVDFARNEVEVNAWWNNDTVEIVVSDDGPGFAPDILKRIGEPYLSRRRGPATRRASTAGSGSACSSRGRCWSAPAPRYPSPTAYFPITAPWYRSPGPACASRRAKPIDMPNVLTDSTFGGLGSAPMPPICSQSINRDPKP